MSEKKELIIIGAGPGGYAAAFRAADLGIKVTLIDPEVNPGGVCLYRGCIPSKALLHVARVTQEAQAAEAYGIKFKKPDINVSKIADWKNKVVEKLTGGLGQLAKARKIEYIQGKAAFTSENEIEIKNNKNDKSTLKFQQAIIATGSTILNLPNIKIDHNIIMDSNDALQLEEIPETLLVVGGGYIGLELGSVYAALGCKVSVAEMTSGFLPGVDRDLVKVFDKENPFESVYFDTKVEKILVKDNKAQVTLKGNDKTESKKFDKVLIAVGRKPNSDSINLDKVGVKTVNGFIRIDNQQRTSVENIFAIGDLTGEPLLAHKASHEGRIAAEVIAGDKSAGYDPKAIPAIVFTNPEIAWCGITEQEAKENEQKVKVVKFPWSASGRAVTLGTDKGLTKLIVDPNSGIILGGGVAGKNAGSLISEIVLAVEMGSTAEDVALTIHPHPTLSETIMESAESFTGSPTHIFKGS
tara:strand:+ start:76 stop:1479 length:1404 start_codon:yes stop_codon:yes gene_type:complete